MRHILHDCNRHECKCGVLPVNVWLDECDATADPATSESDLCSHMTSECNHDPEPQYKHYTTTYCTSPRMGAASIYRAPFQTRALVVEKLVSIAESHLTRKVLVFQKLDLG